MVTGHVTVLEDGKEIGEMRPARWFFNKREEEPTTEVAIRRATGEDLYIVLAGYDPARPDRDLRSHGQSAGQLDLARLRRDGDRHHPGAAARTRVRVRDRAGPGRCGAAATTSAAAVAPAPAGAPARAGDRQRGGDPAQSRSSGRLETEIMCTCGCRRSLANCGMPNCEGHAAQTDEAAGSSAGPARITTR